MKRELYYVKLGRRIRSAREEAGRTQEWLGSRLDPPQTRASIANMESGKSRVLAKTLVEIERALRIPRGGLL